MLQDVVSRPACSFFLSREEVLFLRKPNVRPAVNHRLFSKEKPVDEEQRSPKDLAVDWVSTLLYFSAGNPENLPSVEHQGAWEELCKVFDLPLPEEEARRRYLRYTNSFISAGDLGGFELNENIMAAMVEAELSQDNPTTTEESS